MHRSAHRLLAALLVVGLVIGVAAARTVVLVFDDSGSMDTDGTDRLSPALYATQALIGLLNPTDTLEVVRMSAPATPVRLLPAADPQASIQTVSAWSARSWTPYQTVETAIASLKSKRAEALPDDEDYWLVVFTDGDFRDPQETAPVDFARISADLDGLRAHFANRKLGIIFLGIGPGANDFAEPWAQAGVVTFVASDTAEGEVVDGELASMSSNQIIAALFEIATLIAGRDPESAGVESGLRAVSGAPVAGNAALQVTTELPLKRLIVFEQGSTPTGLRVVEGASSFEGGAGREAVAVEGPLAIQARGLHASISSISGATAGQVLGPGTFTVAITANTPVPPDAIRFLPEVALGLDLTRDDGPTTRCVGDALDLFAAITNSGDGSRISIDAVRGVEIVAEVVAPQGERRVRFTPLDDDRYSATTTIGLGLNEVSVTARYPGYFVLRSRVFLIDGVSCTNDATLDLSQNAFEARARFLAGLQTVADFEVSAPGVDPSRTLLDLDVAGLPLGWVLEIEGQRIESPGGRATNLRLGADGRLRATLAIAAAAQPGRHEVRLTASAQDPLTRFARADARFTTTLLAAEFRASPTSLPPIEIPPTSASGFETVASERLRVVPLDPQLVLAGGEGVRATLQGLPVGVRVTLAGTMFSASAPAAELSLRDLNDATLTLQRDRTFVASERTPLQLQFESLDPRVRLLDETLTWPIGFAAPTYSLEPTELSPVAMTRTASETPQPVGEVLLSLRPTTAARAVGDELLRLQAIGLPPGVELHIAGSRLTAESPGAEVELAALLPGRLGISRSASYTAGDDVLVSLRVESLDGRLAIADAVARLPLQHLQLDLGLLAPDTVVPVPRTASPDYLPVESVVRVDIRSSATPNPQGRVALRVDRLPTGVQFEVAGERLTDTGETLSLLMRDFPVTLRVLRSNAFRQGGEVRVTLEASSDDPAVEWTERFLPIILQTDPRTLSIEPLDTPWSTSQAALATRFQARLLLDGEPITGSELDSWSLAVSGDGVSFARGMPRIDRETGTLDLALRPNCIFGLICVPGLNAVGERILTAEVRAAVDEVTTRDLRITVTPVGWWAAWGNPMLRLLLLLLLAYLAYRFVNKPRFPRHGGFREVVTGFGPDRPTPKYLPFANAVTLWQRLWPLGPEQIRFRGVTIRADSRMGQPLQMRVVHTTASARSVKINGATLGPLPERLIEGDRLTYPSGGTVLGSSSSITFRVESQ